MKHWYTMKGKYLAAKITLAKPRNQKQFTKGTSRIRDQLREGCCAYDIEFSYDNHLLNINFH